MNWFKRIFGKHSLQMVEAFPPLGEEATLIGQIALTVTPLNNSGFIELDGQRHEVFSQKGYIPAQTKVRITGRRMGWFTVEETEDVSEQDAALS